MNDLKNTLYSRHHIQSRPRYRFLSLSPSRIVLFSLVPLDTLSRAKQLPIRHDDALFFLVSIFCLRTKHHTPRKVEYVAYLKTIQNAPTKMKDTEH